jgi:transcriptional regulator with XRE-family HTH domain
VRDVPQLKLVREDQGWSQRDLAARSGVAPNTISQLERGERKAMPSTVRKLADALGVYPPVLMAESRIDAYIPHEQKAVSQVRSEDRVSQDHMLRYQALIGFLGAPDVFLDKRQKEELQGLLKRMSAADKRLDKRQKEELQGLISSFSKRQKVEALAKKRRYEAGRWAEEFVSRDFVGGGDPVPEEHIEAMRSHAEAHWLQYSVLPSLLSYPEDLNVARSRLASNDPKELVEAAQLVLRRAKRIVEEYDSHLHSFHRIPDHYYEDPAAQSRIQKLQETLSERCVEAAEAVQELVDLYDESLDTLKDLILGMRKESDVLEEFVAQAHDSER